MKVPAAEADRIKSTAAKLSNKGLFKGKYKYFLKPVDYTRTAELPAVLSLSKLLDEKRNSLKILDISSPQLLSAALAGISPSSDITYMNPFQAELDEMLQIIALLGLKNVNVLKADVTNEDDLKKLKGKFDYIFSSSVFEHIHPEEDGDIIAIKNIFSLLNKGGLFILSVPFYKESFNEYKYGDVYGIKGNNNAKTFFQRFYDEEKLETRLINPSNLTLESILFLGERYYYPHNIKKRFAHLMQNRLSAILFGRLFFLFSRLLFIYSEDYKELKKPYIAVIALRNAQ